MATRFSIRYKFLSVTTLLLVLCVGAYLLLATRVFKTDKTELVFDYSRSTVSNIASDIDTLFRGISDKMKIIAIFYRDNRSGDRAMIKELMRDEADIVSIAGSDRFQAIDRQFYSDKDFLETYVLPKDYFAKELAGSRPVPFQRIREEGEAIWNATQKDGPPLIGFGKSVVEEGPTGAPLRQFAVIAYLKADKILKSLTRGRLNQVFITNREGEVVVHADHQKMVEAGPSGEAIVQLAREQKVRTSVLKFAEGSERMLGAFSKSYGDELIVLSKVSESKAFSVVNRLVYRSLIFATIVVTVAFIVAILFSRTLTRPIETLVGGMKRVAEGDLSTRISVKSQDEIFILATSFNSMISDLSESRLKLEEVNRDLEKKVKERTYELEQQNQAVKEAQEALLRTTRLATVGEIAGQAAHEVLNPLTSILSRVQKVSERLRDKKHQEAQLLQEIETGWREDFAAGGFSQLVKSWESPSTVKEGASLIEEDLDNLHHITSNLSGEFDQLIQDTDFLTREGNRISRIVNSMRSLSVVKGEVKQYRLAELVDDCVKIMADLASQHDTSIEVSYADDSDLVLLNNDEFTQSMTNILRNALQAVQIFNRENPDQQRQGVVKISTEHNVEYVDILIQDNGSGISEENKHKLFDNHFSTKPIEEGTGIGLSISRRFVRAFHGDIFLKSSEFGEGATFVVRLPMEQTGQNKESA